MNKENIIHSLDGLGELSKLIGKSQNLGRPLPTRITKQWELSIDLHLEILRRELGLDKKGDKATVLAVASTVASSTVIP